MKNKPLFALLVLTLSTALFTASGRAEEKPSELYRQGEFQIETFATALTADVKHFTGGYGIGVAYAYHQNWTIGARLTHTGFDVNKLLVEDIAVRLTARLPLSHGLAPYTYLGAGYNLARDRFQIKTGAGLEWRFTPHWGVFTEAGANLDFESRNSLEAAGGIRYIF